MATLNAASLTGLLSATLAAEDAENLIDAAINRIAAHGYTMTNLAGTAGTKSKAVSQTALGWIQAIAVALYPTYKNSGSTSKSYGIMSMSKSESTSTSLGANANTNPDQLAEQAANALAKSDWNRAII